MKFHPSNLFKVTLLNFGLLLSLSCQKDSDMLAEYVVENPKNILLNDIVIATLANQAIIIEPIDEETYKEPEKVIITEVTPPTIGSVEIKEGNTIIYTPEPEETGTDEFDYTTTVTNPDKTISTQTGKVSVTVTQKESTAKLNPDVAYWKTLFDEQYAKRDKAEIMKLLTGRNRFQEYYYMAYYFDGLLSIWQATGDNKYLDNMLEVINITIADAKPVTFNKAYLGWKADASYHLDYSKNGVALWESYYWKAVTTLLRIMHQSPRLLTDITYKKKYDSILAFTEMHIWNKWEAKGANNIYRNRTHMASHWARMGMELYIITGKQKYKKVFDNISFGKMQGQPSNLREKLYPNPKVPGALAWNMTWSGSAIQDTPHANDIVSFWILAYENGMYWNRRDIDGLIVTLDKVIFTANDGPKYRLNVDGTGGYDVPGRLRDWLKLARYDRKLQDRLIKQYLGNQSNANRYPIHSYGNFALNEKILSDGRPVYPEQ